MSDAADYTVVHLATGPDAQGSVYARSWEIPADGDAIERLAAMLTEEYGEPAEWVTDEENNPITLHDPR